MEPRFIRPVTAVLNVNNVTKSERAVLAQALDGKSNKDIAELLFVTESCVKAHMTSILRKLNVQDRVSLIIKLARLGHYEGEKQEENKLPLGGQQ